MRILSLFDGMSCGMIATVNAKAYVERYVAYEIDKYATKVSTHNFPSIEHLGDVFEADFRQYEGFDFLIGGSPCTYWSIAQTKDRETTSSGKGWNLFCQYTRALEEAKPQYFIYENNKSMAKGIRDAIRRAFGFEEVCINSALVSAQNRQRYYWVGRRNPDGTYSKVNVPQPKDRGILLRDVLDNGTRIPLYGKPDKGGPVNAHYSNNAGGVGRMTDPRPYKQQVDKVAEPVAIPPSSVLNINPSEHGINGIVGRIDSKSRTVTTNKGEGQKVFLPVCLRYERSDTAKAVRKDYERGLLHHGRNELNELHPRPDGKSNTLTTVLKDNPIAEPVCSKVVGRKVGSDGHRKDNNPSIPYEQRVEINENPQKTNTLTTVSKDNMITEPVRVGCMPSPDGTQKNAQAKRVYAIEGKSVTQGSNGGGEGAKTGLYAVPVEDNCVNTQKCAVAVEWDSDGIPTRAVSGADGKAYTVYTVEDGLITIKGKQYPIKLSDGYWIIRKLTVRECMRLQTVPNWYDLSCISDTQAYKCLGNGWTCEVITHLIECCLYPREKGVLVQGELFENIA